MQSLKVDNGLTHKGSGCPTKNFDVFSFTVSPRAGGQTVSKAASILFVVQGTGMV